MPRTGKTRPKGKATGKATGKRGRRGSDDDRAGGYGEERQSLFGDGGTRGAGASGVPAGAGSPSASRPAVQTHEDFVKAQLQQQQQHKAEQEEHLDALDEATKSLAEIARNISREVSEQSSMLDDMDTDVEKAQTTFDTVNRGTQKLIDEAGGSGTFCLILGLIVILVVLIYLVFFT